MTLEHSPIHAIVASGDIAPDRCGNQLQAPENAVNKLLVNFWLAEKVARYSLANHKSWRCKISLKCLMSPTLPPPPPPTGYGMETYDIL